MNAGGNYNRPKVVGSKFESARIGTAIANSKQSTMSRVITKTAIQKAALLRSNARNNPIIAICWEAPTYSRDDQQGRLQHYVGEPPETICYAPD